MDFHRKQLKEIRGMQSMSLDQSWIRETREDLLRHIRSTQKVNTSVPSVVHVSRVVSGFVSIFVPEPMIRFVRPVATSFAVALIAASGWIASVSASNSVPGDVLYNVKLAAEKTQVAVATVAGSKEWKAQLHLQFAGERAREAKEVVVKNEPESSAQVASAMQSLNESITAASATIQDVSNEQPEKALALAQDANQKTEEIVTALNEVTKGAVLAGDAGLTKKVVETTKIVNDASIATVEAVVQKQNDGTIAAAPDEVKNLVEKKIENLVQDQKNTNEAIAIVQTTSSSTLPVIKATSTVSIVVPSSIIISTSTPATSTLLMLPVSPEAVEQAVQKVSQTSAVVEGVVQQAKDLVQNNQLLDAIHKVQEASQATLEVKQAVAEAQLLVPVLTPTVQDKKMPEIPIKTNEQTRADISTSTTKAVNS